MPARMTRRRRFGQGEEIFGAGQVELLEVGERGAEDEPESAAGGGAFFGLTGEFGADHGHEVERLLAVAAEDHGGRFRRSSVSLWWKQTSLMPEATVTRSTVTRKPPSTWRWRSSRRRAQRSRLRVITTATTRRSRARCKPRAVAASARAWARSSTAPGDWRWPTRRSRRRWRGRASSGSGSGSAGSPGR